MIGKRQSGENPSCTFILVEPNFESLISGVRRPTTVEVEDREGDAHSCCMKREVDAVGCRIIGRDSTE